jgi:hypothetical protein
VAPAGGEEMPTGFDMAKEVVREARSWPVAFEGLTPEEFVSLTQALIVVSQYEKRAMRAARMHKKNADMTQTDWNVKGGVVTVTIKQGANG